MIKITDSLFSKVPAQSAPYTASTSYTAGNLLYMDTTAGTLKEATSSAGTTQNIIGVGRKTFTSASTAGYMDFYPLVSGAVLCVADCTNATAVNQLLKFQAMTDAGHVANTSTSITTTLGVFLPLRLTGSAGTQLYGYFIRTGQVDA